MRIATALVVGLLLAVAGCGGGGDGGDGVATTGGKGAKASASADARGNEKEQALKHAKCMRENGVPDFPDPKVNDNGGTSLDIPEGTDPKKVEQAMRACRQYEPNGGEPIKLDPQRLEQLRAYAKCMRENGVENFPDPTEQGIQIDGNTSGLDPTSPTYQAADKVCARYAPPPSGEGPGLNTEG